MVTNRVLTMRFRSGTAAPDGTYGAATRTYGEATWTYGQVTQDAIDTAYTVTAYPGWGARVVDWEYRQWDTEPAMEIALLAPGGAALDYSVVASAELVLTMVGYAGFSYSPRFPLTVGVDRLTRTWEPADLPAVGRFRVAVILTFDSGRTLTVPAGDGASFVVRDGMGP